MLKRGVKDPFGSEVKGSQMLGAMLALEKSKPQLPDNWWDIISAPNKRWRLVYTAPSKDVTAASKGEAAGSGAFVPIPACQKFEAGEGTFENGIFLGPVASLTFKGFCSGKGKQLSFDVDTMYLGVGPWRGSIPLKAGKKMADMDPSDAKKLPFFIYAYVDEDIIVGRGRSGGLAVWVSATSDWMAKAGVLQVYK